MRRKPDDPRSPTAPDHVQSHSSEFFDRVRALLGDRFAGSRVDPDRGLRVTVIDLSEQDVAAITGIAEQLTIADWVRVERADHDSHRRLPYPFSDRVVSPAPSRFAQAPGPERAVVDPAELRIVLDGPLTMRSGETTRHAVLLTNLSTVDIKVATNGHLTSDIVDDTGAVVGPSS